MKISRSSPLGTKLYQAAREQHPARWSGQTRNWMPTGSVALNPERDAIVNEV